MSIPSVLEYSISLSLQNARTFAQTDHEGQTPLHIAAVYGSSRTARCLIEDGKHSFIVLSTGLFLHLVVFALLHIQIISPHLEFSQTYLCFG